MHRKDGRRCLIRKDEALLWTKALALLAILGVQLFLVEPANAQDWNTYCPTTYRLVGATSHVSGQLNDLQSDDGTYMSFGSYSSVRDTLEFVSSNASDADFSPSKGTHSNFSAQQYGPDSFYDKLTEENTGGGAENYELDLEVEWTSIDHEEKNEELAIYVHKGNNTHSVEAAGGYMVIGDGSPDWGSPTGTISFWIRWDTVANRPWGQHREMEIRFFGANLILDWGGTSSLTSSTSFMTGQWYFVAITWNEQTDNLHLYVGDQLNPPSLDAQNNRWVSQVSTLGVDNQNNFMASRGGVDPTDGNGDDLRYWSLERNLTEIQSDYDTELTGSEASLRSYFKLNNGFSDIGTDGNDGSTFGNCFLSSAAPFEARPTENIRVEVWFEGTWRRVITDLENGWNNVSVSSYLDSSTLTIRFKGAIEAGDITPDSWSIDATLLHVWSDEQTAEVEFIGLSDGEDWLKLTWTIVSAWTANSVNVTMQLYDYTLGNYSSHGNGSTSYTSSVIPDEDKTVNQTITVGPSNYRNSSGYWRVKISGINPSHSPFELKVDKIEVEVASTVSKPFDWAVIIYPLAVFGLLIPLALRLKRRDRAQPSTEDSNTVYERFDMASEQMIGAKILLEVDPTSNYHKAVSGFASEALANDKSLFIFTSKNSPLHSEFSNAKVRFFLPSSKISSSKRTGKREIFVPMSDLSVLLDTFSKIPNKSAKKPKAIVFDNLSDTILMCGFEKTYKFLRFLLEIISSPGVTALFIFNPTAHDPAISSSIRGLFKTQLIYSQRGLIVRTL